MRNNNHHYRNPAGNAREAAREAAQEHVRENSRERAERRPRQENREHGEEHGKGSHQQRTGNSRRRRPAHSAPRAEQAAAAVSEQPTLAPAAAAETVETVRTRQHRSRTDKMKQNGSVRIIPLCGLYQIGIYSDYSKEVIRPSKEECIRNSRASSTKMRWAVKSK